MFEMLYLKCLLGAVSTSPLSKILGFHKRVQALPESEYLVKFVEIFASPTPTLLPSSESQNLTSQFRKEDNLRSVLLLLLATISIFSPWIKQEVLGASHSIKSVNWSVYGIILRTPHSVFVNSRWHFIKSSWFCILSPSPMSAKNSTLLFETYLCETYLGKKMSYWGQQWWFWWWRWWRSNPTTISLKL